MAFLAAFPWEAAGLDPATLAAMADEFGRIYEDRQPGRKPRWRIYLGKRAGRALYISRLPTRSGITLPSFETREHAELLLESMRSAIRSGAAAPDELIDAYLPEEFTKELVETWCAKYLRYWEGRINAGEKSPTSHRELVRWAKSDGHWGYWWGRDVRSLTNGDVREWHAWLVARKIGPKTRKNVSDGFRAMLNWASASAATGRGQAWPVPVFPTVSYAKPATPTVPIERVLSILDQIPWESRGIFLAIGFESVRFGTAAEAELADYDAETREILWSRARKGQRLDAPVGPQKNREVTRRPPWAPELIEWLSWRVAQTTDQDRLAGRAQALFWHPEANNAAKKWNYTSYRRTWNDACKAAGEKIAPQAGTRHSILSRLAEVLTPHELQSQSQHRSLQSLSHYTTGARANHAAMVRAIRGRNDLSS